MLKRQPLYIGAPGELLLHRKLYNMVSGNVGWAAAEPSVLSLTFRVGDVCFGRVALIAGCRNRR
jgi:hypothetical protein